MSDQIDIYTGIHKGQRKLFFKIMDMMGMVDYNDRKALDDVYRELVEFKEHVFLHASMEEKHIHPLLNERIPGGASKLEDDHHAMHQMFNDLDAQLKEVASETNDPELTGNLAIEFYRSWIRFAAFYFTHINEEEESIQPLLWKICTARELDLAHKGMITSQTQDQLLYDLRIMLRSLSKYERPEIFYAARASLPKDIYQSLLKEAERILDSESWADLKRDVEDN